MLPAILALFAAIASAQPAPTDPLDLTVRVPRIAVGPVAIGEDHPVFDLYDFPAEVQGSSGVVSADWVDRSFRWVRGADGLSVPQARLSVFVAAAAERTIRAPCWRLIVSTNMSVSWSYRRFTPAPRASLPWPGAKASTASRSFVRAPASNEMAPPND